MAGGAAGAEAGPAGVLQTLRETPPAVRLVLVGVFVNQFGAFLQFFLVLYLTERGFSDQQAGVALGSYSIGAIAGVLFGGALSDRLGPRWTIVLSVAAAALFTMAVTALDSLPAIVVVVALAGGMTQAARPAVSALLFALTPSARAVMVFAMYRTALNSGMVAGPLVAVWLSTISWNLVFYFDAVTALVYAAIAAFALPRHAVGTGGGMAGEPADGAAPDHERSTQSSQAQSSQGQSSQAQSSRKAGYLTILRDYRYLAYLALMLANGLVHVQFFAVLPLQLKADGYPTWAYGWANAVSAFLVISCELLVTRTTQKWPAWVAVIGGWILLVIGRGMFGLPGGLIVIFGGSLLAVVGQIIGGPAAFAYPAKVAPPEATGRYLGSAHAMFVLGYAIGPIAGIALWLDIGKSFWVLCLVFGLVMTVAGIWGMRPTGPPDDEPTAAATKAATTAAEPATEATEATEEGRSVQEHRSEHRTRQR